MTTMFYFVVIIHRIQNINSYFKKKNLCLNMKSKHRIFFFYINEAFKELYFGTHMIHEYFPTKQMGCNHRKKERSIIHVPKISKKQKNLKSGFHCL